MSEPGKGKRALLIAIANYRFEPWNLDGPANDVALMHRTLTGQFGFEEEDITVLRDEEATRAGIKQALDALVEATAQDDIVVIFYAGHGSQMTCREGDEPDGLDETLVPWDSSRKELEADGENRDITDDELHEILTKLGEKTSYTTLIFDCCHSGTITRDAFATKVRAVPSDLRPAEELPPSPVRHTGLTRSTRIPGPSGWLSLSDKYVLIAGCADSEESGEKQVGDNYFGALTYHLIDEIRRAGPGTTYRDVFEGMKGRVTAERASQNPQMEGRLDRELFGVRDIEPIRYLGVEGRSDRTVTLAGGAAHGVTAGSRWAIVPKGTSDVTEQTERMGEIEITVVGAVQSEGEILDGAEIEAIGPGCRALETRHSYGDLQLACEIAAPQGYESEVAEVRRLIEASPLVKEAAGDAAPALRVYLVDRDAPGGDRPVPGLRVNDGKGAFHEIWSPTWVAVDETGDIAAPAKPLGKEGDIVENLEAIARHRQALGLRNPDPDSWIAGRVTMEFQRILPDGTLATAEPEGAGGSVVFEEGEIFELSIRNEDSEPVYLNLLSFDAGGRIKVLYPPRGSNEALSPGTQLKVSPPRAKPFVPRIEAGFPRQPFPFGVVGDDTGATPLQAIETFKLFVTTEPADFSFLEQERLRGGVGSALELLMATATGHATRGSEMVMPESVSDWTTIERSFLVRGDRALDPEGGVVDVGSARISASGLEGAVRVHGWGSKRGEEEQLRGPALAGALAATGIETRQTIELAGTREVAEPGTRSGTPAAEPAMELELRGPGTDFGQMVLATNEGGLLSWHFPEPVDEAGTRGKARTRSAAPPHHRFTLSASVEESADEPKRRSLVGTIGKKLIQELVFPLVDPAIGKVGDYFVGQFEEKKRPYRLRTYTPEDYLSKEAAEITGPTWEHLASGRSLLLLHGAFNQSHTGFASMPAGFLEELHRRYEGRIFAFDHFTLSHGPRENADWLLQNLPPEASLELDLLCHARGGLVGRVLTERQGAVSVGSRELRVRNVVFAGAPNAGTELADPKHLGSLLDRYTNVLNLLDFLPPNGVTDVLEVIITVAKQVSLGALKGLDGLQAMVPGSAFQRWLDAGEGGEGTRYFALASDFASEEPSLRGLVSGIAARQVFGKAGNDLIVPTSSVFDRRREERGLPQGVVGERRGDDSGVGLFPITEREVFEGVPLGHFDYFADDTARERILGWLAS